jgi:CoA:oxalate CoA-transferase
MSPKLPMLTGYRVLDITQFVAGPTCTRILAELGADVIKVELAPHGDRSRAQGIKPRGEPGKTARSSQSTYFFQHNHSKRSIALAWKHPRAIELVKSMAAKPTCGGELAPVAAPALPDDLRPSTRASSCSISVAGQTGPLSAQPATTASLACRRH